MLIASKPEIMFTDNVEIPPRLRAMSTERVDRLVESISALGLQTPITVRSENDGEHVWLVAGRHRLEAARRLGIEQIAVIFVEGDDDDFRLWEIAENLHRSELTPLERAEHIAEWIRLTNKMSVSAQLAPKLSERGRKGEGRPRSGTNAASEILGVERTDAQRSIKIDAITPEAKQAARDAGVDKVQSSLLRVAAAPKDKQVEVVAQVAARRPLYIEQDTKESNAAVQSPVVFLRERLGADFSVFIDMVRDIDAKTLKAALLTA